MIRTVKRRVEVELPRRWPWLLRGFTRYCRRYLRTHFHAVRLSKSSFELPNDDEPLIVVLNPPSWWDPLLGIILSELLPDREHFAAIDVAAIKRYAFFRRLGFVGIDSKSVRGAMDFLQ